jgi:glycerol-3-phosphate cytidylyltransferase
MTLEDAAAFVREAQSSGKKVVLTNGVFDLLHVGHVRYLSEARQLGDVLVVGLNSDASTTAIKGPTRPLVPQDEREEILLALRCVDAVVIFDDLTAERLVAELKPDFYVKGGDYSTKDLPEASIAERLGGQVRLIPEVEGRSTTNVVNVIRERFC